MPLDLTSIQRDLVTDCGDFTHFVDSIIATDDPDAGFDTETSSTEFPDTRLVGFSLYSRPLNRAVYYPLGHDAPINLPFPTADLQRLAAAKRLIVHGGASDFPLLIRAGVQVYRTACTYSYSNMLQAQNPGLKDQVLEYGIVDFRQVRTYQQIIAESRNVPVEALDKVSADDTSIWGFNTVDVSKFENGLFYACNDAIWTYHLNLELVAEHDALVGDPVKAAVIRFANDETTALLAESSAEGYVVDPAQLEGFIKDREAAIFAEEAALMQEIRVGLGWADAPPPPSAPNLFEAFGNEG